jgi:hypothetical protein
LEKKISKRKEKLKIKIDNNFWVLHLFHIWDFLISRVGK